MAASVIGLIGGRFEVEVTMQSMNRDDEKANILLVDDRYDSLMALESALVDLDQNFITATSGREALKYVLKMDFAVILLDVHMPEMDGFETAELMRKRMSSRHTPIIFITGYTDELHVSEGYSLGAVDYILAPVVPEILRAKVSVFVELFKKNQQVSNQAASLRRRATQLHDLTQASISIHSAASLEEMLQVIADTARHLLQSQHAAVFLRADENLTQSRLAHSGDDAVSLEDLRSDLERGLSRLGQSSQHECLKDAATYNRMVPSRTWGHASTRLGRLGIELTGRDNRRMGLIEVVDVAWRQFGEGDEAILLQLSQLAAIAIENVLSAKAREANRLKDEFLATLSHELRTPLNAMLGWIRLIRSEDLDQEIFNHGLRVIERNVDTQSKLIDDLLDISRITSGKLHLTVREVCLNTVVDAAIEGIKPNADSKGVTLSVSLSKSSIKLWGDSDRLQQVVSNLLSNAVKFTPKGGRVEIELQQDQEKARLRISDSGQGIEPDVLPYIFDHFRQADSSSTREHLGLGVGLAIVRHIVEMHDGSVSAESEGKGQGTSIFVALPLLTPRLSRQDKSDFAGVAEVGAADRRYPPDKLKGLRILVVDDDSDARQLVSQMICRYQGVVLRAGSADEAIEIARQEEPDVLLSDIAMPGKDGYTLIQSLRASTESALRKIPGIALTAHAREEDAKAAMEAGFEAHVAKPIEPNHLVAVVAHAAGRDLEYA